MGAERYPITIDVATQEPATDRDARKLFSATSPFRINAVRVLPTEPTGLELTGYTEVPMNLKQVRAAVVAVFKDTEITITETEKPDTILNDPQEQISLDLTTEQKNRLNGLLEMGIIANNSYSRAGVMLNNVKEQLKTSDTENSNTVTLNLTSTQKNVLINLLKNYWKALLSNPEIEESDCDNILAIIRQLTTSDDDLEHTEIIAKSIRIASKEARQNGLVIGTIVGIANSSDRLAYELVEIDGKFATIRYNDQNDRHEKVVRLDQLFDANRVKQLALKTTLSRFVTSPKTLN